MHQDVAPIPHRRRLGRRFALGGLAVIGLATLLPSNRRPVGFALCLICGDTGATDALLNVLLFMPLGVGLALLGVRRWRALAAMCALTAVIEGLQYSIIPGRDASVGDIITNSIGGALGFLLVAEARRWQRPARKPALWLATLWSVGWLAVQSGASAALAPAMTTSAYYGQINRSTTPFPGAVLRVTIGGEPIPNHKFDDSPRIRDLLELRSTETAVGVTPNGPTTRPASIVRIADAEQNEILTMQQSRSDFIFGLRTRTSVFRLRPLLFRLPNAIPPRDSGRGDTLQLTAVYGQTEVTLRSRKADRLVEHRFRLTPALGYVMVFPFSVYINDAPIKKVFAILWIAAFVLPIGYWSCLATRQPYRAGRLDVDARWIVPVGAVLLAGLIAVPKFFGLMPSSLSEWLAAAAAAWWGRQLAIRSTRGRSHPPLHSDTAEAT